MFSDKKILLNPIGQGMRFEMLSVVNLARSLELSPFGHFVISHIHVFILLVRSNSFVELFALLSLHESRALSLKILK